MLIAFRRRWMTQENVLFAWHLWLTLVIAWWSFILALPAPTFSHGDGYSRFARINPDEGFWAIGFGVAAAGGFAGCWAAWPARAALVSTKHQVVRMFAAMLVAFTHGLIAVFMFQGSPTGTGSGTYVLIMCSAYLLMRAEYERS